jgi:hypothetical protein
MERPSNPQHENICPVAYLITFTCYSSRFHGDPSGSVDRFHNRFNTPLLAANPRRIAIEERRTRAVPYRMNAARRNVVLRG